MLLLDILVSIPSLLMTNIAWYIRLGLVLICLIVLLALVVVALCLYTGREDRAAPHGHRPEPPGQP